MQPHTAISFVRHGHVHNPQYVFYGRLPHFKLSENGYRQANCIAQFLRNKSFAALFSSPMLRTRQTAEIILEAQKDKKIPIHVTALLNEALTPFDGRPLKEIASRNWDVFNGARPKYEQPSDVLKRTHRFVFKIRQKYSGRHIIAVTHGYAISFMILWAMGLPIQLEQSQDFRQLGLVDDYPAPASLATFVYDTNEEDEIPSLEYANPCR